MTREEARAWLEVADHVEDVELRRAYLRKVKAHKPERDPEGFKKTREAYELLREPEERAGRDDREGSSPPPIELERAAHSVAAAPDAPVEAWDRGSEREVLDALAALRTMASASERLAHLRTLLGQHPDSLFVVRELELELCACGRYEEAADVLRAAIARGLVALEPILFTRHALRLTDEELARLERSEVRDRDLLVALALIARKRWADVEARSLAGLQSSEAPLRYLPLILELFSRERAKRARNVLKAVKARVAELGTGMSLREGDKAYLLLVSELAVLGLSRPLLATLARDVRRGTVHETRAYLLDVEHHECIEALDHMAARAPALRRWIGTVRVAPPRTYVSSEVAEGERAAARGGAFRGVTVAGVALAVMLAANCLTFGFRCGAPRFNAHTAVMVRLVDGEPMVACEGDGGCAAAHEISTALDENDCARALTRLSTFERLHTARMDRFVIALRARALAHCPE